MSSLVYVAEDGQLVHRGPEGRDWKRLTHPMDGAEGVGWQVHHKAGGWGWPCPSPDGRTIAAFHYPSAPSEPIQLRLVERDGVGEQQLLTFEGSLPIYLQWSSGGHMLAALAQDGEGMQLWSCTPRSLGQAQEIEHGSPLFFQWIEGSDRVLVHVGDHAGDARVLVRCIGEGEDLILGQSCGVIAAPQIRDGQIWLSLPLERRTRLICVDARSGEVLQTRSVEGWVQLLPSPHGPWMVLQGLDPISKSKGLGLLNWEDGELRHLPIGTLHSVHWLPDERRLIAATETRSGTSLAWTMVDVESEEMSERALFWPTPDESMRLRFSSQFSRSHPRLSPDGTELVYAGFADPRAKGSEPGVGFIHRLLLTDTESGPELLDRGSLAVYLPDEPVTDEANHASG